MCKMHCHHFRVHKVPICGVFDPSRITISGALDRYCSSDVVGIFVASYRGCDFSSMNSEELVRLVHCVCPKEKGEPEIGSNPWRIAY